MGRQRRLRVYLAARYDRRLEMVERSRDLRALGGILVTAQWVEGLHEGASDPETLGRCAAEDLADITTADLLITFTETPDVGFTSGGRHVELGYALGLGIPVLIVGPAENVFHHVGPHLHAQVVHRVDTWAQALEWVRTRA